MIVRCQPHLTGRAPHPWHTHRVSLAAQPYRPRVVPVSAGASGLSLPGVALPRQLLHFLVEHPTHLRKSEWNQLPDHLYPRVHIQCPNLVQTQPTWLPNPPVLLALFHHLGHASHRWPPSSFSVTVAS